jgi:hypothetical protein
VTPARSVENEPQAQENRWSVGCTYEVVCQFESPLTLADMRGSRRLHRWSALRRNFQGIVFPIPDAEWEALAELLAWRTPGEADALSEATLRQQRDIEGDS